MKLNKKFLSCFTAMTMVMAPMSVLADDTHSITGDGSVQYLETEKYNLILPTSECINFNVDPYGVLSNGNGFLDDIVSKAAGTVTSSATAVINKSSVGLDVSIGLLFDYANASNSAVTLATSEAIAKAGDADLYLTVEQLKDAELASSASYATDAAATVTIGSAGITNDKTVTTSATTLSSKALVISGGASSLSIGAVTVVTATDAASYASSTAVEFSLKDVAYAYEVSGTSVTLSEAALHYNSDNVYAFKIGGYAYPQSPAWKNISTAGGKLQLTMKFTIAKSAGINKAYNTGVDSFGTLHIGIINNPTDGGITDLAKVTDLKRNGTSIEPYAYLENGAFMLVKGQWTSGDTFTFSYDGIPYSLTVQ